LRHKAEERMTRRKPMARINERAIMVLSPAILMRGSNYETL